MNAITERLSRLGVETLFIEPGSPWENGYVDSFNGKLRDELINREIFTTLLEAKVLVEEWRKEYNQMWVNGCNKVAGRRLPSFEMRKLFDAKRPWKQD